MRLDIASLSMAILWNIIFISVVFVMEKKKAERQRVFVLSAFPEFLLDYFGVKLWRTSVKHRRNLTCKCV